MGDLLAADLRMPSELRAGALGYERRMKDQAEEARNREFVIQLASMTC